MRNLDKHSVENQDNNNGNVIDLKKLQSHKELQEYARAQFLSLLKANTQIEHLESENKKLKSKIQQLERDLSSLQLPLTEIIHTSDEQELCEIEIKRLKDIALGRPLNLEETKRLDLLVKNLYVAKKREKSIPVKARRVDELSEDELIALASFSEIPKKED